MVEIEDNYIEIREINYSHLNEPNVVINEEEDDDSCIISIQDESDTDNDNDF